MALGSFAAIGQTKYQAADGLFVDRPYGICAGRPCRGNRRGRAGRAGLYLDLCRDDARQLRGHHHHEAHGQAVEKIRRFLRPVAQPTRWLPSSLRCSCSRWPASRAGGLLSKWYVFLAAVKRACHARRDRRTHQRGRRLLLLTIVKGVFDEPLAKLDPIASNCARCWRSRGCSISFLRLPRPAGQRGCRPRRSHCSRRRSEKWAAVFGEDMRIISNDLQTRSARCRRRLPAHRFRPTGSTNVEAMLAPVRRAVVRCGS